MKEFEELNFPKDLLFYEEHEWIRKTGEDVTIGISDYAQDQLGDIVFVELPETGTRFSKGEVFGTVESVKSVSELYMPLAGSVVSINTALEESPELVNSSPYADGWMLVLKPDTPTDMEALMTAEAYLEMLRGSE